MERIEKFTEAIKMVMEEYSKKRQQSIGGLKCEIVADDVNRRYQLLVLGWQGDERIHHLIFHIDIINEKIWIQVDNTEVAVANLLVEKGMDKKDIVLAYFSKFHRQFTDFAVA